MSADAAGDDDAAYEQLERLRWGGSAPPCPNCGTGGRSYRLRAAGGFRRTRTGAATARRVWKCGACRRQFSVLTGTVLAGSRLPVRVLAAVLADWQAGGRPTASAVAARHAITPEAARHLLRRLDAALGGQPGAGSGGVLGGSPTVAAAVRRRTPARIRPRSQVGPTADYGTG